VTGVIGRKKFAYDIWGETVNIASRMEEAGHMGMVNISEATYEYIKDYEHIRIPASRLLILDNLESVISTIFI
ncbi:MAG: adenylate/guanylate cyclase domain-containing protein, partial [Candidatus Nitrosocaldaceae archaeon]